MKDIFHQASVKLAALYLIIIIGISLLFSTILYRVASAEIERTFSIEPSSVSQILRSQNVDLLNQYIDEKADAILVSKAKLRSNLFALNIFIAVFGGFLSYYLARMTLRPIEEAHAAQSRFTADASHELRTPIAAMRIENELTLTEPKLTIAQAKAQLESNIEELDKLTALSEGLLKLSRLDENGLELTEQPLAEILESSVETVRPLAEGKNQKIIISKLPDVKVRANTEAMSETFITLLENAVKYSEPKADINVKAHKQSKHVQIDIVDKGMGITEVDLPRIFDRFYRADQSRTKNKVAGYGIGLSIAKATVEAHGGSISVISKPNKGSTFTITLPL